MIQQNTADEIVHFSRMGQVDQVAAACDDSIHVGGVGADEPIRTTMNAVDWRGRVEGTFPLCDG